VTSLSLFRCLSAGAAFALIAAAAPASASAQSTERKPSAMDLVGLTASGSYLAARHAGQQRDAVTAAAYYKAALRRDPKNIDLLNRVFLSYLIGGDVDDAVKYAERVIQTDKSDMYARLAIGVHALKQSKYATARRNVALAVRGPITDLTASRRPTRSIRRCFRWSRPMAAGSRATNRRRKRSPCSKPSTRCCRAIRW
jgi:tetratricopeptide (TPR) repeat protein